MGLRRVAVAPIAALLVIAAGCAPERAFEPSAPAVADARTTLVAATNRLSGDTVTVTQEVGTLHSVTRLDPRLGNADLTIRATVQTDAGTKRVAAEIRALGETAYLQLSGLDGIDSKRWLEIDRDRLAGTVFDIESEKQFELLARQFATVRGAPPLYTGTMWIREHVDGFAVNLGGEPTTTVPFTATIDEDGRLTSVTVDPTSLGLGQSRVHQVFSGFGDPVAIDAPPAGQTLKPTDEMLAALGIE